MQKIDPEGITYRVHTQNIVYKDQELTYLVVTLENTSDDEIQHRGYCYVAGMFKGFDMNNDQLPYSDWMAYLFKSKRIPHFITIPPHSNKVFMYHIKQLFNLKAAIPINLRFRNEHTVTIEQPLLMHAAPFVKVWRSIDF